MDVVEESPSTIFWDSATTRFLIATRLKYENEYKNGGIKKSQIWDKIHKDMLEEMPNMKYSPYELTRKFANLLTTYKRIRYRFRNSETIMTSWEYFNIFDAAYSDLYSIGSETARNSSEHQLESHSQHATFDNWNSSNPIPVNEPSIEIQSSSNSNYGSYNASVKSSNKIKADKKPKINNKRRTKESILSYLKDQDIRTERRHRQTLKVEIKKIKVEEEKLKVLSEIRDILKEIRY